MASESPRPDKKTIIEQVVKLNKHIYTCKGRAKTLKEELEEKLAEHTGYKKVLEAERALKAAKEELARALQTDGEYNDLAEKLADENNDIKETRYTLGLYLVEYHAQTDAHQIELDEEDTREVIVTGRLGRAQKFQTNLFGGNEE